MYFCLLSVHNKRKMHEFVLSKVPLPLSYICYPPPKDPSDIRVGFFHLSSDFSDFKVNK